MIMRSSPHVHGPMSTSRLMLLVISACIPATAVLVALYGIGVLVNLGLAIGSALLFEAIFLKLRGRRAIPAIKDFSAVLTAVLIGLAIPPYCAWWIPVVGSFFAIVLCKQLFGGIGMNPFNPAMVAYVILLISFPVQMSAWIAPVSLNEATAQLQSLASVFDGETLDGYTMATPLDVVRNLQGNTLGELYQTDPLLSSGRFAGYGSEMINLAFLAGGIYLIYRKVFTWHAPVAMIVSLTLMSFFFWGGSGSESNGSPIFHLLSGATMMGAFFIITDPVSGATSKTGRLIFGALVGILIYVIRAWGNYPDGVAFAVLLANLCAPFIDYYTVPRTYGHNARESVLTSKEGK